MRHRKKLSSRRKDSGKGPFWDRESLGISVLWYLLFGAVLLLAGCRSHKETAGSVSAGLEIIAETADSVATHVESSGTDTHLSDSASMAISDDRRIEISRDSAGRVSELRITSWLQAVAGRSRDEASMAWSMTGNIKGSSSKVAKSIETTEETTREVTERKILQPETIAGLALLVLLVAGVLFVIIQDHVLPWIKKRR